MEFFYLVLIVLSYLFLFFQTVKYFNNEHYETEKYDEFLKSKFLLPGSFSNLFKMLINFKGAPLTAIMYLVSCSSLFGKVSLHN